MNVSFGTNLKPYVTEYLSPSLTASCPLSLFQFRLLLREGSIIGFCSKIPLLIVHLDGSSLCVKGQIFLQIISFTQTLLSTPAS